VAPLLFSIYLNEFPASVTNQEYYIHNLSANPGGTVKVVMSVYNNFVIGIYPIIFTNNIYQENKNENKTNTVIASAEYICGR
jgi:hypothetical protein